MQQALREEKIEARIREVWTARVRRRQPLDAVMWRGELSASAAAVDLAETGWEPLPSDGMWGSETEVTVWLRAHFEVDGGWRPVLEVRPHQCEVLGWLDGRPLQAFDAFHHTAPLPRTQATSHVVALEAWCGLPVPNLRPDAPPPQPPNHGLASLALLDIVEETEALARDMRFLLETARQLDGGDPRRHFIVDRLDQAVARLDFRRGTTDERFHASAAAARASLAATVFAEGAPGGHRPTAFAVGHAHIDTAWLWRVEHTRRKCVRTFTTALALMDRYPDYVFACSQAQQYAYVKEDDPALYRRIKAAVARGQWEPVGGMWVEADCNVSGGEALVRQFLYGVRFFEAEFGRRSRVVWLPDAFGFSAALPQIMRKVGMPYFMTTKIHWNQVNRPTRQSFRWRGIDGSSVLVHFPPNGTYNADMTPAGLAQAWAAYDQKPLHSEFLYVYGYGDGGGGPTDEMCETANRAASFFAGPRVRQAGAESFFTQLDAALTAPPQHVGELYLEYHRGTLTSQARAKQENRRGEILLQTAEQLSSVVHLLCGAEYPAERLGRAWKKLLLNQFHDILPGSSIREVYEDAAIDYEEIRALGGVSIETALDALAARAEGGKVLIYNPLSWSRADVVAVSADSELHGQEVNALDGERSLLIALKEPLPPLGWAVIGDDDVDTGPSSLRATPRHLENQFFSLTLNADGEMISLVDRRCGREVLATADGLHGNTLIAYEDKPLRWDAWDVDPFYTDKPVALHAASRIRVVEKGPLRAAVEIEREVVEGRGSRIIQRIMLYRDLARIDIETYIDWKERQTLLKAAFPLAINASRATYDIQFGSLERPTHSNTSHDEARFEVCGHRWADLSEGDYGVSVLSDSRYGWDIHDNVIRLTLLKSAINPDPTADLGIHHLRYALLPHRGDWRSGETVRRAGEFNVPPQSVAIGARPQHPSSLPRRTSLLEVEAANLVVEAVKQAEDSDSLIVRLYEAHNQRGSATLRFCRPVRRARCVNLLEDATEGPPPHVDGHAVTFDYGPFEIKTLQIDLVQKSQNS